MNQTIASAGIEQPNYQELMEEVVRLSHENDKLKNQRRMLQQELLKSNCSTKATMND